MEDCESLAESQNPEHEQQSGPALERQTLRQIDHSRTDRKYRRDSDNPDVCSGGIRLVDSSWRLLARIEVGSFRVWISVCDPSLLPRTSRETPDPVQEESRKTTHFGENRMSVLR